MYGWRGSIGIIVPSSDRTTEMDFATLKPEGVAVYVQRVRLLETHDPDEKIRALQQMDSEISTAAITLADAQPDLIAFCCTTGSFLEGPGTDKHIMSSIKQNTGIEAITTATALLETMTHLKVRSIDLLTPYNREIGQIARRFFIESIPGLTINHSKDLGIVSGLDKSKVPPYEIYREAKNLASVEADALVISCTALQCIPIISALERDLQRPVITSNIATVWLALHKLGIGETYHERGQLLGMLQ